MGPISANIAPIKKIWGDHDRHGVVERQFNGHRLLPRIRRRYFGPNMPIGRYHGCVKSQKKGLWVVVCVPTVGIRR